MEQCAQAFSQAAPGRQSVHIFISPLPVARTNKPDPAALFIWLDVGQPCLWNRPELEDEGLSVSAGQTGAPQAASTTPFNEADTNPLTDGRAAGSAHAPCGSWSENEALDASCPLVNFLDRAGSSVKLSH